MAEYIEREALLALREEMWQDRCDHMVVRVTNIMNIPAADVAPVVHGRWIHDINNLYGCSECMKRETMSPKKLKPYCPNCGADMRGGNDE